ncbi:Tyrosine-protein kinase [Parasponia andersonii]|uniref:Tyrosine-protein kinase n=1 Tax=Parasponia andersonii TaxID=3476 RepID=A0A2P5BRE2_PARAD|nr:Tyrosine-protein kinase [Parasponia andersonii]
MIEKWKFNRFREHLGLVAMVVACFLAHNMSFCWSMNDEEIGELEELEMLDLGYNKFSGPLPANLGRNLSLTFLLLDNNGLLGSLSPELNELKMISEFQVDENQLSGAAKELSSNQRPSIWKQAEDFLHRRVLQQEFAADLPRPTPAPEPQSKFGPLVQPQSGSAPASPPSSSSGAEEATAPPKRKPALPPPPTSSSPPPVSAPSASPPVKNKRKSSIPHSAILAGAIGGATLLVVAIVGYLCIKTKVANVKPWATGLSGQLQKAFVTGVPKLKRSELETACEDFSNVIGSSPIGTLYKGTLSNGVEIAVAVVAPVTATTAKEWSENLQVQFCKKIDMLSKVNHKNFVNLIGYCQEEEPFTRMMVFEYAPNGTLFEHLHIREAEHLDWGMRLRIAMGMVYCLDHMHQLQPPIAHNNLNSSAVRLTEDYAAKIAEFSFWNDIAAVPTDTSPKMKKLPSTRISASPECNVYSFGVILFEMVTGRLPYSVDNGSLEDWASDYLRGEHPLKEMVDPTLSSFQEEQLEQIGHLIKSCVHHDPRRRPTMREVGMRLRDVTGITPDGASPRISPLWWAELELMSTDAI